MKTVMYTDAFDPESSAMNWVYYDKPNQNLYIQWNNNNISAYGEVSQDMFDSFRNSSSKGAFYNQTIHKSLAWPPGDGNVTLKPAIIRNDPKVDRAVYEVTLVVEPDSIADAVAYFSNEHVVAVRRV